MAGEENQYLEWLREQRCYACQERGPCEAHHKTGAGMGKRSHDSQAFALCTQCHRRFHDGSWEFRKWVKAFRREWQELAVVETRARYLNRHKDPWGNLPTHDKSANTSPPPDDSATTSH